MSINPYLRVTSRDQRHSDTGEPNSYVHSLEERVAFLEKTLLDRGIHDYDQQPAPISVASGGTCSSTERVVGGNTPVDAASRARAIVDGVSEQLTLEPKADPSFTSSLLNRLYTTEAIRDGLPRAREDEESYSLPVQPLDRSPATLPEPEVAEHLIKVFFELANFSVPMLHEPTFRQLITPLLHEPQTSDDPKSAFFAFVVFAIALLTLQKHDSVKVSTALCERYFTSALKNLDCAGLPPDIEGIQALLLISLYSYLHPHAFQPWRTLGMAMRLVISLGLHTDLPLDKTDPLTLDTRRRVFWVTYAMDRTVGNVLGRPFGISDGAISCEVGSTPRSTSPPPK